MSPPPSNGRASSTTAVDHASVKFSLQSSGSHTTSQLAAAGSSLPPRGTNGHGGGPSGPNGSNGHGSANGGGGPSGPKVGAFVPVPKQPIRRLTDSRCDPEELTGRTNYIY
jgi:hypothetical protein